MLRTGNIWNWLDMSDSEDKHFKQLFSELKSLQGKGSGSSRIINWYCERNANAYMQTMSNKLNA